MDDLEEKETLRRFFAAWPDEDVLENLDDLLEPGIDLNGIQDGSTTLPGSTLDVPQAAPSTTQQYDNPAFLLPNYQQQQQQFTNDLTPTTTTTPLKNYPVPVPVPVPVQVIYDDRLYSGPQLSRSDLPDSPPDSEPYSPPGNKHALVPVPVVIQDGVLIRPNPGGALAVLPPEDMGALTHHLISDYMARQALVNLATIPTSSFSSDAAPPAAAPETTQLGLEGIPLALLTPGPLAPGGETPAPMAAAIQRVAQGNPSNQQMAGLLANIERQELQRKESILMHQCKKRKHSMTSIDDGFLSQAVEIKQEPGLEPVVVTDPHSDVNNTAYNDLDYDDASYSETAYNDAPNQFIKWQPYQQGSWLPMIDAAEQELAPLTFNIQADKGFNFSNVDDSFICQKKNHFQITTHVSLMGQPKYVKTNGGLKLIDCFMIHIHGIKMESFNSYIRVEQSQANRSKRPFQPVRMDIAPDKITKVTIGRLHYSETTSNNMRKKGKRNPDQRFFKLVVGIHAYSGDQKYMVAASISEKIIVRASNPGQFESDVEVMWQKGLTQDSIFHAGRIGINTDQPDEALVVHGNLRLTGHITQPSDLRAKENIREVDSKEQLRNIGKLRIVDYNYIPEFNVQRGLPECDQVETGVIAQEVQDLIPNAVIETGDVHLPGGGQINNFLTVNRDRIYMENVGAVKELCRLTNNLEMRIVEMERMNRRLAKLSGLESFRSRTSSSGTSFSRSGSNRSAVGLRPGPNRHSDRRTSKRQKSVEEDVCLSESKMKVIIFILLFIICFCIVGMVVLVLLQKFETSAGPSDQASNGIVVSQSNRTTTGMTTTTMKAKLTTPASTSSPQSEESGRFQPHEDALDYDEDALAIPAFRPPIQPSSAINCLDGICMYCCEHVTSLPDDSKPDSRNITEVPEDVLPGDASTPSLSFMEIRSQSRRKRDNTMENTVAPSLTVTSVVAIGADGTLNILKESTCAQPCGQGGNFTYRINVPVFYKLTYALIELNTTDTTTVLFCPEVLTNRCNYDPEPAAFKFDPSMGSYHSWKLPIGLYVTSHYWLRITVQQDVTCTATYDPTRMNFVDYNLHFIRNLTACHSG